MKMPVRLANETLADLLREAVWQKSSKSGTQGECVEVADNLPDIVAMRDSKDPGGRKLIFERAAWTSFIDEIRRSASQTRS